MLKNKAGKLSVLKISLIIVAGILLLGLGLYVKIRADIQNLASTINSEEVNISQMRQEQAQVEEGDPINVLILGADSDDSGRSEADGYVSRSDTIIILSLNPQTKSTKMVSIPRDTITTIDGEKTPDKINHAYAYGGIKLTVETVQDLLQIPIDYYAVVDMSGLAEMIDAIGGITVTSPLTFTYRGTGFVEGQTREVNGVKAMNFARMRYDDPLGEVGRQNRQKIVIKAVIDKILSLNAITYYPKLLQVAANNVRTNFDLTTALTVYPQYIDAFQSLSSVKFDTMEDLYLNDVFYFHIPVSSRLKVANELRLHSGLDPIELSALEDPLEDNALTFTKAKTIILNQFPSGANQEQIDAIQEAQSAINQVRVEESFYEAPVYYPVTYEPVYEEQPVSSYEAASPVDTGVAETQPPAIDPVETVAPSETPVDTEVPEVSGEADSAS